MSLSPLFILILIISTAESIRGHNPCCSFPCQHGTPCMTDGLEDYYCDCTNTRYYGKNCEIQWVISSIRPTKTTVHHILVNYSWFWSIVNNISWISDWMHRILILTRWYVIDNPVVYSVSHPYTTSSTYFNHSQYSMILPPIPKDCPKPMGVAGKDNLPDIDLLAKKLFLREKFIPDVIGLSTFFTFYAQHITHQFLKTDKTKGLGYTWGNQALDVSHIYGKNLHDENLLRTFNGGKLKSQVIKNEEWPPYHKDALVEMTFPKNITEDKKFALGHHFFTLMPGLFMLHSMWLREHNRVCSILTEQHPEWDDEQLFQTAKLIIQGETLKIFIADYVNNLVTYKLDLKFHPEVIHGTPIQFYNRIPFEYNLLYRWHPMMPDSLTINGTKVHIDDMFFRPDIVIDNGLANFASALTNNIAGSIALHNHGARTVKIAAESLELSRSLRLQPYNQYRRRFKLKPYESFFDLTGDERTAKELEDLYGDIEALEFFVGIFAEKHNEKSGLGQGIIEIGASYSITGILANPICSPQYWRPSTFGGEVGFNIVKDATIRKVICDNIEGDCPEVGFRVPNFVMGEEYKENARNEF